MQNRQHGVAWSFRLPHHPKSTILIRRAGSVLENADPFPSGPTYPPSATRFYPQKACKTREKWRKTSIRGLLEVSTRNSLPTTPLIREILSSHSLRMRAILIHFSQKIAKLQANVGVSNARFQANIWPFWAAEKRTFSLILRDLTRHPAPHAKKQVPRPRSPGGAKANAGASTRPLCGLAQDDIRLAES